MVLTSSYGATWLCTVRRIDGDAAAAFADRALVDGDAAPSRPSSLAVVTTSCRCGTLLIATGPSASSVAHRIGSTAFLAPEIWTSPFSGWPPSTTIFCMVSVASWRSFSVPVRCGAQAAQLPLVSGFVGRERLQRQRVDLAAHALAQRGVDHAVAGQRQLAAEGFGYDGGLEMHAVVALHVGAWRRAGPVRSVGGWCRRSSRSCSVSRAGGHRRTGIGRRFAHKMNGLA